MGWQHLIIGAHYSCIPSSAAMGCPSAAALFVDLLYSGLLASIDKELTPWVKGREDGIPVSWEPEQMRTKHSGKAGIPNCLSSVVVLVLSKLQSRVISQGVNTAASAGGGARLSQ